MNVYKYNKEHLMYGHSTAITDQKILNFLDSYKPNINEILSNGDPKIFCAQYLEWIKSYTLNTLVGIEKYPYCCYSNGTTESFDKFYLANSKRRFRCFKGEYLYHELSWRDRFAWSYIEDDQLDINDAVIISFPFADTGNEHISYKSLMAECEEKNIPVLVDLAYYTISSGMTIDLNFDCITDITFSLSKTFPVSHARIGIRLSKVDNDDSLFVYQKNRYTNRLGAHLGLTLINNFESDYIVNRYKDRQIDICKKLNVIPSNTVLFGIGNEQWQEYNRGTATNRLSFHRILHEQN